MEAYAKLTWSNVIEPSATSLTGSSGFLISVSSSSISAIRRADAPAMESIAYIIASIIRLESTCIVYVNSAVRLPVVRPSAALLPLATMALAPTHEISSIHE